MDSEAEIFCKEDDIVYTNEESDHSVLESEFNYVVLNDAKIQSLQKNDIERVSTVLFVTEVEARILLLHYHWNVSKIYDDWLFDEQRVRRIVGIFDYRARVDKEFECGICFDSYPGKEISTLSCAHRFCNTCWTSYIKNSIKCDGIGCLLLKCPLYKCSAVVGHDIVDRFTTMKDKSNYSSFLIRSYVESKKNMMWCPAPRCDHVIEFAMSKTGVSCYDVTCLCSFKFCWKCTQEAHSPVDCDTACEWLLKNRDESGNRCWILANSKLCPKCKVPIQKNGGCSHMRCISCGYGFCWDCLCSVHGGHCKQHYDVFDNSQRRINQPMREWSSKSYLHYHEGWLRHESLSNLAMMEVKKKNLVFLKENKESANIFVREAWLQVIEWRRFLKWTYVYGYYMSEHEHDKQQWFENFQGEAESSLEELRECLEKGLEVYLKVEDDRPQAFSKFKTKTIDLTKVTKVYFEKLVKAVENGFADFIC